MNCCMKELNESTFQDLHKLGFAVGSDFQVH